ncbi:hypothetical protein SPI_01857 [Niveomyces insectorum RCEF 264]|uniref:Thioredoxin reductase n=1 Tax=Niveomyces insectorum RCEF 264 TaxID=1081102 RepID=A0A167ZAM2_9HYPO|nr:hypothetical protein SPI_01857 [Niveomyces insectorum RCEF 264]
MTIKDLEALVARVSQALNSARIPCVLWGHCLLRVHGVPSVVGSIDFVIPDDLLQAGAGALDHAANQLKILALCPNSGGCSVIGSDRHTPPPALHSHLDDSEVTVGLYLQRDTLWFLPPLSSMSTSLLSPTTTEQLPQYFLLASDREALPPWRPGRGPGFFKSEQSGVVVPRTHVLLEAFMRLYARDVGTRIGSFAMAMIAYMEEYVDDDGFLDVDQLPEVLKKVYLALRQGRMESVSQWSKDLQQALKISDGSEDHGGGHS